MLLYSKGLHKSLPIGVSMRGRMFANGKRSELVVIHDEEIYRATGEEKVDGFLEWLNVQLIPSMDKDGKIIVISRTGGKTAILNDFLRMTGVVKRND